jgi:hypothetical protein
MLVRAQPPLVKGRASPLELPPGAMSELDLLPAWLGKPPLAYDSAAPHGGNTAAKLGGERTTA